MLDTIREHIPFARTLTDDRLTAIAAATVLLALAAAMMGVLMEATLLGGAVALVVAHRMRGRRSHRQAIVVHPATPLAFADEAPSRTRAPGSETATAPVLADDVLLARAIALRDRVSVRR